MTAKPYPFDGLGDTILRCLPFYPEGTVGYQLELDLVRALNSLCKEHGYGRVPQLARDIETLWRNPSSSKAFERERRKHLRRMDVLRKRAGL